VTTKVVLLKNDSISNFYKLPSGSNYKAAAEKAFAEILKISGLKQSDLTSVLATGCGAGIVDFADGQIGDLACCALGSHRFFPEIKSVIEVGGQAAKVMHLSDKGKIINFIVSEKCAAGSGRFLQVIAKVLQINIADAGELSLHSQNPVNFASSCAVFGESEAISRVSEGAKKEDIIAGVHRAMATKISTLSERISIQEPCAIVGGGALDIGLIKRIEEISGHVLKRPKHPQIVNAYGAALYAKEGYH
jgi:predicted CoA-substrate-specific enzyme activase